MPSYITETKKIGTYAGTCEQCGLMRGTLDPDTCGRCGHTYESPAVAMDLDGNIKEEKIETEKD